MKTIRIPLLLVALAATLAGCQWPATAQLDNPADKSAPDHAAPPPAPAGIGAVSGNTQLTLSWTAVSGASGYNLYYSTSTGVTPQTGVKVSGITSPFQLTGLTNGATHYFVLTAFNAGGESPASLQNSAVPGAGAPTGISTSSGDTQVTVNWTSVGGASGYNLYYSKVNGFALNSAGTVEVTGVTSPYTVTGLTDGTTYYFAVTAVVGGVESTASSHSSALPQVPAAGAPANVNPTAGNGQAVISWTGVNGAASYNLFYSPTSGVTTSTPTQVLGVTSPYTLTGLADGTTYYLVVSAVNGGGQTASNQVSVTTNPAYTLTLTAGTGGAVSPTGSNKVYGSTATTIVATPANGYGFVNWTVTSGSAVFGNAANAATTVSLAGGSATVKANFAAQCTLTAKATSGGTASPSGPTTVNAGTATTITATPSAGYMFVNWTVTAGTAQFGNAASPSTTVTLTANATIQANFVVTYSLTMAAPPGVTTVPAGATSKLVGSGIATNISATASAGYQFLNWSVVSGTGVTFANVSGANTTVTLTSGNATIQANMVPLALWAQAPASGTGVSQFLGVAVDGADNTNAVGCITGSGPYAFGGGTSVSGAYSGGLNAQVVQYNSSGAVQWAQTVTSGPNISEFTAVTVDSSGNVYAVGYITDNGQYSFGNGVTATGGYASGKNAVIVKYSSPGVAQWAATTSGGNIYYNGVAVDGSGSVYAVGIETASISHGFGNGVTASGGASSSNALIVKYNPSGAAQWAQTVTTGPSSSGFFGVAIDSSGSNIYAVGDVYTTGAFTFGSYTVTGTYTGNNALIVSYSSSGTVQWAQTVSLGASISWFAGVTVDGSGNVDAAGDVGSGTYGFGSGVTATGTSTGQNVLVVQYNSSGTAQWADSSISGSSTSDFTGVSAKGVYSGGDSALIVKYSPSGTCQWAQAVTSGGNTTGFAAISTGPSGNSYAAGYIYGNAAYGLGNSVTAAGPDSSGNNSVIVKY